MPWQDIVAGGVDEWSDYGDTDDERAVDFAAALEDSGREDSLGRVARVARDARARGAIEAAVVRRHWTTRDRWRNSRGLIATGGRIRSRRGETRAFGTRGDARER